MRLVHVQRLARQVRRDFKVKQESKVSQERKPTQVRLVLSAHKVAQVLLGRPEHADRLDSRDHKVSRADRVTPVLQVSREGRALQVLGERPAPRVP